jgi:hypothetical protein
MCGGLGWQARSLRARVGSYRLNPDGPPLPPWYHHANVDEARRLWSR